MKNTLLTCILFSLSISLSAQTRFTRVHPNIGGGPVINILQTDTGYVSVNRYIYSNTLIDFMKFDLNGNLTHLRSNMDTSVILCENGDKSLISRYGRMYLSNTKFISSDSTFVTIVKLSSDFDTIEKLDILDFEGYDVYTRAMKFDTDSTIVLTGLCYRIESNRSKYDFWAARIDTAFNVLWQQRVEDNRPTINFGYTGLDIVVDQYGSLLFTGTYNVQFGPYQAVNRSFAARLDQKTGHVHWLKEYRHPHTATDAGASYMFALDEGNGTYSFVDVQYFQFIANSIIPDTSQLRFGFMDTTGTILWDTLIGPVARNYEPRDMYKTPSGSYYVAGLTTKQGVYTSFGFVFSPQGDSINYVIHRHKDTVQNTNAIIRENLWNFQPTPDGGFIHIGNWVNPDTMQNIVHTWLLKTDEYGCKIEGCEIGLQEVIVGTPVLKVYPNPANTHIYIELAPEYEGKEAHFSLTNMNGVEVLKKGQVIDFRNHLNIEHLPKGLYLLRVAYGGQVLGTAKVLVE